MATTKSKKVIHHRADNDLSGLGDSVVKILDADNGNCICYIGVKDENEVVHFTKPVCLEALRAVVELMNKKKFGKALNSGNIEKAQKFANKKFSID